MGFLPSGAVKAAKALLPLLMLLLLWLSKKHSRLLPGPYPPVQESITADFVFPDLLLQAMGFRRLAADVAWMGLLQTCVPRHHAHEEAFGVIHVKRGEEDQAYINCAGFKEKAWRVVRDDPYFRAAYLYSSLFLAFEPVFNDPETAVDLIKYGLKINPEDEHLRWYMGIIVYKTQAGLGKALPLLEKAARRKEAPALLHSILAGIYEKQGKYDRAIKSWEAVLRGPEENFYGRAKQAIERLRSLQR